MITLQSSAAYVDFLINMFELPVVGNVCDNQPEFFENGSNLITICSQAVSAHLLQSMINLLVLINQIRPITQNAGLLCVKQLNDWF